MMDAFSTPRNRTWTLVLLGICGLTAIGAVLVGIDDNLPGIVLALLAASAFVLAFAHPWKRPGQFRRLLYGSAITFAVSVLLHNVLEAAAYSPGSGPVHDLLDVGGGVFFFIAVLICPAGLLVGAIGAAVSSIGDRRQSTL